MRRPAPIWEPAPPETSARPPEGPVRRFEGRRSGVVAHLAAHLGEEPPLGGGETVDAARRDLVEHAVDLRLRGVTLDTARRLGRVAGPGGAPRMHEHAGLAPAPQVALGSSQPPVAHLQVEEAGGKAFQIPAVCDT